ncbi:MAG TPA: glycosyltransferase family 4 protein [Bacteroidales bacterium]|nr:glycosyltransferase family 4 protein [Bacteroidales bacterium]
MKKAAFIKYGSFSHINESVLAELRKNFPDYDFDVFDLMPDKYSMEVFMSLLFCLREYGDDILTGRKKIMNTYNRTAWFFNKKRHQILSKLAARDYAFTFQTQALFDAGKPGTPHFIYTDHTHLANLQYPGWNRDQLLNRSWIALETATFRRASMVFTMSSNITRSLIRDYDLPAEKVTCVYSGSNVTVSLNEKFDENRFSGKNILFVGVDWLRKGGPVLVEAFRLVRDVFPDATLTIAGCDPAIDMPGCTVLGKLPLSEVKKCYNEASVFCMPTLIEPFGIAFLEAMAHKLPVVATNIGAIPDFVHEGKNGFLVQPNDITQLGNALIRMLDSSRQCREFGEYGSRLFWERYTWEKTGARLARKINGIIAMDLSPERNSTLAGKTV